MEGFSYPRGWILLISSGLLRVLLDEDTLAIFLPTSGWHWTKPFKIFFERIVKERDPAPVIRIWPEEFSGPKTAGLAEARLYRPRPSRRP